MKFYCDALGLPELEAGDGPGVRVGESVILVDQVDDAPQDAPFEGAGWRYLTIQVFAVDSDQAHVLAHGGRETVAPTTLGTTARISMVKDPAGNWIELSQRASLVGSLEPR
jgi:lactoylglutathione lyase